MNWLNAVILGIVEGVTEFLPVSSTGHLKIVEKLMGYDLNDAGLTAFTAIIQVGAIIAAIVYFWKDLVRIVVAWAKGLTSAEHRQDHDYKLGWGIILGSIPVAVVGLLFKHVIETTLSSLWVVAGALLAWSLVMWLADRADKGIRHMGQVSVLDAVIIGCFQALAPLFPGISRSGATISAGLFRGFDRVTATRLSFFMGIPALVAAGGLESISQAKNISSTVGWGPTLIATVVSGGVAFVVIGWLLRFISKNNFASFVIYRVLLGVLLFVLLAAKVMAAS